MRFGRAVSRGGPAGVCRPDGRLGAAAAPLPEAAGLTLAGPVLGASVGAGELSAPAREAGGSGSGARPPATKP